MSGQDDPFDSIPPLQPNSAPAPAVQPGYQPSSDTADAGVGSGTYQPTTAGAGVYQPTTAGAGAYQPQSAYSPYSYGGYGGAYGGGSMFGGYGGYSQYGYGGYGAGGYGGYSAGAGAFGMGARRGVAAVAGGVQDAMARFARISAAVDDTLRSLHMLFDALFGLGMAAGALAREARVLLRAKAGPAAFIARLLRRIARIWRLLVVAVASPIHSPFGLVLGALGITPPPVMDEGDDSQEQSGRIEQSEQQAQALLFDSAYNDQDASNL